MTNCLKSRDGVLNVDEMPEVDSLLDLAFNDLRFCLVDTALIGPRDQIWPLI